MNQRKCLYYVIPVQVLLFSFFGEIWCACNHISSYVSEKREGKVKVKLSLYLRGKALKGFRKLRFPEFQ